MLFFSATLALLIAATAPAQDPKKELDKLQGEWTLVSWDAKGLKIKKESVMKTKLTIQGDQWTYQFAKGREGKHTFKIGTLKELKTIDLTSKFKDMEGVSKGIYKLDGDTLTVCRTVGARERPKEFKITAEEGSLEVWKRAKK